MLTNFRVSRTLAVTNNGHLSANSATRKNPTAVCHAAPVISTESEGENAHRGVGLTGSEADLLARVL